MKLKSVIIIGHALSLIYDDGSRSCHNLREIYYVLDTRYSILLKHRGYETPIEKHDGIDFEKISNVIMNGWMLANSGMKKSLSYDGENSYEN